MTHLNHIDGQWVSSATGATFEDRSPADERDLIGAFPDSGAEDVARAVASVAEAWPSWAAASPEVRADALFKAADIMSRRADEIAAELTREEGKTIGEARNEARRIAANFRLYAGEALRLNGETYPSEAGQIVFSLREAVGVVAVITPWNFPLSMAARKIAPALAAGNGVIFKPSEMTPLMGQRLVEVLLEAGIPPKLLALVQGRGPTVGRAITAQAGIDAITFTGSYAVGRDIQSSVSTDTRCQLEMGGKNATVVLADADPAKAAAIIERGAFGLTGQACTGTSRVLVARPLYDAVVEKLASVARAIKVGPGTAEGVKMGPLATRGQYDKVLSYVAIAREEGARIVTGGESLCDSDPALAHGYFISPAVIADLPADSRLLREEIFGPVVAIRAFDTLDEAIAIADETEYGLAVSLVTNDLPAVLRFARATRHGVVKVNGPTTGVGLNAPFGGYKHSSNQAAKEQGGATVMDFYTRIKSVYLGA
ncbi:MAG: aldehyde dehydrogenase family protein [Rhizobiales bacterium]|nr:aldehyde dehydrogenase family protein [Hyphomicrobiales bacterium]